jgi:hypothetical protein
MNAAASRVFISYRRDDASGHAGRLGLSGGLRTLEGLPHCEQKRCLDSFSAPQEPQIIFFATYSRRRLSA